MAINGLLPPSVKIKVLNGAILYDLGECLLVVGSVMGVSYVTWQWVQFSRYFAILSLSLMASIFLLGSGLSIFIFGILGYDPFLLKHIPLEIPFLVLGAGLLLISLIIYWKTVKGKE